MSFKKNLYTITIFSFVLLCSCSTVEKAFEEQIITNSVHFANPKVIQEIQDEVAYKDYLVDVPVYEKQMLKQNPIESIQVWDPGESVNRAIFGFNDFVIEWVITPIGIVYSFVIRPPLQKRIENVYDNVSMPRKLINNLLQFKPVEASSVLSRFILNTTVGIGGIFDFADYTGASFLKRPPNQNFEKTLAHWGAPAGPYMVIPFLGPSDLRGLGGQIGDYPTSVFTYYLPNVGYFLRANGIIYFLPLYYQAKVGSDPYTNVRDLSRLQMRGEIALEEHTPQQEAQKKMQPDDQGIMETLGYLKYVADVNFDFASSAETGEIKFKGQEHPIHYNVWMQKKEAPLVFILPGFGGDYDSGLCTKVAEDFYKKDYSVVATSSVFSEDFATGFKNLGKPGWITHDTEYLYIIIKQILHVLRKKYPSKITKISLVGYSMGGFYTAFIAAKEKEVKNPIFENYISVHSPGNLSYALSSVDKFLYESYKNLTKEERASRQLKSIGTIFELVGGTGANSWNTPYNLTGEDARFLIGFNYIRSLFVWINDEPIASFSGYYRNLLMPAYKEKTNISNENLSKVFGYNNSYWKIQDTLRNHDRLHFFVNGNDPLLDENSLKLLQKIVPKNRLHFYPQGGHLGNLPQIQNKIIRQVGRPYVKIK